MTIRHSDPDLERRAREEERRRQIADDDLWMITGSSSNYDWRRRRAGRIARETGIPLSIAIRDEIARVRLDWRDPSGAGARCGINDRALHDREWIEQNT